MDIKELAQQVQRRRQKLNLSQETLADQAGISRNYLSMIERGEARNVSMGVLNRLAIVLSTSPSELTSANDKSDILISPGLRELALADNLSFSVIDKLARIPRRGKEPQDVDQWRQLYEAVKPYLEEE